MGDFIDVEQLYDLAMTYSVKLLQALLLLIIGLIIIKRLTSFLRKRFERRKLDPSVRSFLLPGISLSLKILLGISIATMLGAEMTSFVAIIGSIGFAVGLALQGSLANFAGGLLILVLKPYKVGDYIETKDHSGTVNEIQIFYTTLDTPDNKRVIIPNKELSNSSLINYSINKTRRVDFKFGISYDDDIKLVKDILNNIVSSHSLIIQEPEPKIVIGEHGDNAIIFYVRVWCKREDYWTIFYELQERVKLDFDQNNINIPYPQMDVHVSNS
ncbi:mechanosensitive ion channel family protein [Haloplasma contractile]|uniref:Small conductance mechanosensitive ion channel protein MscS n=1 Tax=Haloplasma contractile SSD-17B TaxID=1033810 RepID=U2E8F5_9MOLU|nr:mechanosensitive ion channel domain-containing protein [Haloplasma contractile]ERJ11176.1 Small conductance mechanosensitive ion channel protein MscS [Haloplasma contractile SSD-17B]